MNSEYGQNEKAVRLLEYLLRLASLRTKLIRNITDYEKVLWLKDIPRQRGCFTQAWGRDEDYESDIWVEIQNPREPELPTVPRQCEDWVDKDALRNKNDMPELRAEITRQDRNPHWVEGADEPEFISRLGRLVDYPNVQKLWDRYIEERWWPWVEEHNVWESIHRVYSSLFAIHQEQLRLGEEYELVLGLGLLTWQTPTGQLSRRHLIVANASLEFEARLGKFTIRSNSDGANLRCELDMLDIEEQPARAEETAKVALTSAEDDPWDRGCIEGILKSLVHSINSQGEYDDIIETSEIRPGSKPVVEFAPAIILRKRSSKGLTETLKRIKERIEQGEPFPTEFGDLAEINEGHDGEHTTDPGDSAGEFEGEIFFPKASNEEQRRIVDKLRGSSGVLVQGPPGTGKSHTIANLVSHLLATGQRILVTSKTPRALKVLEGLLPQEIRPLCINLLGSGSEERRSLELSVGGILRKNEEWNEAQANIEIERLNNEIRQLREEKAQLDRRLRAIRESETLSQTVAEGAYQGTAAQIAKAVKAQEKEFCWFVDVIPLDKTCPVDEADLQGVLGILRMTPLEKQTELLKKWPNDLPKPEVFADIVNTEKAAEEEEREIAQEADLDVTSSLDGLGQEQVQELRDAVSAYESKRRKLVSSAFSWLQNAVLSIVSGSSAIWHERYKASLDVISRISKRIESADATKIEYPQDIDSQVLFEDAKKLKDHFETGGKLGWGPFRPRPVKEASYVVKTVRVNGRLCDDLGQCNLLLNKLYVSHSFKKIWRYWPDIDDRTLLPFALQFQSLKEIVSALDEALSIENDIKRCKDTLEQCSGLIEPIWNDDAEVHHLLSSCRLKQIRFEKSKTAETMKEIESSISILKGDADAHSLVNDLLVSIRDRDIDSYRSAFATIQALNKERKSYQYAIDYLRNLQNYVPRLADDLGQTCFEDYWEARIQQLKDAWRWSQAKVWLEEYIRKEDLPSLAKRCHQVEDELSVCIAKIASLHAWLFCFSRLNKDHRRHMEAWQQSMRRLGKGTGKHAPRHRREAQKHLNECREAVPAWVMPLHRVWDTVDPSPGMFDVIIVDEASQCGFEAFPLYYTGKKILIVGDDKQISPDAVGLPRDAVHRLMEEYLSDFKFKSSFDVESSLFDHGKLRYGTRRITLREHFRCMPEIIRFSNDLCYRDTPLVPLRQYGPDRLSPLERVFVSSGYREGAGNRVVNRPEADAIASKITELCSDSRYASKTMGVVVLQGDAQAGLIEDELLEFLGAEEMEKRRLICGNPYSFQGDERDIMFLSMVAAPNERIGPLTKAADERRFNVAASRARDQVWLFHSVSRDDLSSSCLRRSLLEFFEETRPEEVAGLNIEEIERRAADDNRSVVRPPQPFDSWFEVDVSLELLRKGYIIIPQFEVAGKRIDLVIEGGRARLAVECDGDEYHGLEQYEQDMQRQRMLERCGWAFFRIRASQFYANRQVALENLWRILDERGIFPKTLKHTTEDENSQVPDNQSSCELETSRRCERRKEFVQKGVEKSEVKEGDKNISESTPTLVLDEDSELEPHLESQQLLTRKNKFDVGARQPGLFGDSRPSKTARMPEDWQSWEEIAAWANNTTSINTFWGGFASKIANSLKQGIAISDKDRANMKKLWKMVLSK